MADNKTQEIKVLYLLHNVSGGIGTHVFDLIRFQLEQPDIARIDIAIPAGMEHQVPYDIKAMLDDDASKIKIHTYTNFDLHVASISRNLQEKMHAEINGIVQDVKPSVIHSHSSGAGLYARVAPYEVDGARVPIVHTPHGFIINPDTGKPSPWGIDMEKKLRPNTDCIIHVSEAMKQLAEEYGLWQAEKDKVIHNGVRERKVSSAHPLGADPTRINIGYVGRLDDRVKGLDVLELALGNVRRDDFTIHFIGDNVSVANEHPYAQSTDMLQYHGWVHPDKLDDYIKDMDVLVLPSMMEAGPLALLEALRNEVPVIGSNRGGIPEVIARPYEGSNGILPFSYETPEDWDMFLASLDTKTSRILGGREVFEKPYGFVFNYRNPGELIQIIDILDKGILRTMGKNARMAYEKYFTNEICFNEVLDLYRTVLSREQSVAVNMGLSNPGGQGDNPFDLSQNPLLRSLIGEKRTEPGNMPPNARGQRTQQGRE